MTGANPDTLVAAAASEAAGLAATNATPACHAYPASARGRSTARSSTTKECIAVAAGRTGTHRALAQTDPTTPQQLANTTSRAGLALCPEPRPYSKQGILCPAQRTCTWQMWQPRPGCQGSERWRQHSLLHFGQQPHSRQQQPQDAVRRGVHFVHGTIRPTAVKRPHHPLRVLSGTCSSSSSPVAFAYLTDTQHKQPGYLPPPSQTPRLCLHLCHCCAHMTPRWGTTAQSPPTGSWPVTGPQRPDPKLNPNPGPCQQNGTEQHRATQAVSMAALPCTLASGACL